MGDMGVDGSLHRHRGAFVGYRADSHAPPWQPDYAGNGCVPGWNVDGDDLNRFNLACAAPEVAALRFGIATETVGNGHPSDAR
jgi:hypothetical protein